MTLGTLRKTKTRQILLALLAIVEIMLALSVSKSSYFVILFLAAFGLISLLLSDEDATLAVDRVVNTKIFWLVFSLAALLGGGLIAVLYLGCGFHTFDTGIYANILSNLAREGNYYSGIHDRSALSNHFTPNLALLAPFFRIYPTFLWLPISKLIAFLASVLALLWFGRDILQLGRYSYLIPLMCLTSAFCWRIQEAEFHVSTLACPFIICAFAAAEKKRWILSTVLLLLLLGFKEHLPLIWISIGIFVLLRNKDYLAASLCILGGVIFGATLYFAIMPSLAEHSSFSHIERFGPFSMLFEKAALLFRALASVGFLPLLAPWTLLFLIPAFGLSLVSNDPEMLSFNNHYQDIALAVLFVAAMYGLDRLIHRKSWITTKIKLAKWSLRFSGILIVVLNTHYPSATIRKLWPTKQQREVLNETRMAADEFPPSTTVLATDALGPMLSDRHSLRAIIDVPPHPDWKNSPVIVSKNVSFWPLSVDQYDRLHSLLEERIRSGLVRKQSKYKYIEVYLPIPKNG